MQTNNRKAHRTFSQETKGTPCALYLFSFFCYSISIFILFYLVSHKVEETPNLCSAYLMFRKARETNL